MNVLHLASFDRWTGAAALALAEASALRSRGVQASYACVGGYLLEEKISGVGWAHPVLVPGEHPIAVLRNLKTLRRLIRQEQCDVVHVHLSHDHWLARLAMIGARSTRLVRTFHSRRALRRDPLSRWLIDGTDALAVVNPDLAENRALGGREAAITPPPLEPQYVPDGLSARALYGIPDDALVIGCIGKVVRGRGFEDVIHAFAAVREHHRSARMLVVGHGPYRPELEQLTRTLSLNGSVIFAGYHEADLPEHFRAMDLMFFTASGSDHGHRAIIEANGCGTPVASYPIPGASWVIGEPADQLVSAQPNPQSLASTALRILRHDTARLRETVVANAGRFTFALTSARLEEMYEIALGR